VYQRWYSDLKNMDVKKPNVVNEKFISVTAEQDSFQMTKYEYMGVKILDLISLFCREWFCAFTFPFIITIITTVLVVVVTMGDVE
jgi:hypothetical protein